MARFAALVCTAPAGDVGFVVNAEQKRVYSGGNQCCSLKKCCALIEMEGTAPRGDRQQALEALDLAMKQLHSAVEV